MCLTGRAKIGNGRKPPDPVVHLCRAKDRCRIRKSNSRSEADQPFRVDPRLLGQVLTAAEIDRISAVIPIAAAGTR
jgi:hypothetical protein